MSAPEAFHEGAFARGGPSAFLSQAMEGRPDHRVLGEA